MPDEKNNLYLYEALLLRNEYDYEISIITKLNESFDKKEKHNYYSATAPKKEAVKEFDANVLEEHLAKLRIKRLKLNEEIQKINFETQIKYRGNSVSLAQALEIRKQLLNDYSRIQDRVVDSSHKNLIYKEERTIIEEPRYSYKESYEKFRNWLVEWRQLLTKIQEANHKTIVKFKDE